MNSIIEMKNITKQFKDKEVLKRINFSVREGEIFGFLGPSGAGKTTTIKILTSQLIPTSGEGKIFNKDIYSFKKNIFKKIGVLSDNSGVYERLTIEDNLTLFADIYGVDRKNVDDVLRSVELFDDRKKEVKKLSKGMKQRLMISIALIHKPKILFLDEPTSSLDPRTAKEVHDLLRKLNREGTTIFLTTHNMEEADKLCNRVAFLNDGEIVEIDTPENLKLKYAKNKIEVKLKGKNEKISVKNDEKSAEKIKNWIVNSQLLSIHSQEPNLEEIFLSLTGRGL
ncbi:ABC transporter ATP-binding protein [Oceanirhabdus seepicola]|uniref:ABC transporter ATP-binding protein n=1 Tax=Oceanirhabdus seepicola TaxID=2828781 RepID=A0A9J6P780_9CLOT|nr:ABC transporter ATP-binding protein [Oceanirhabdus seepicola]MCM1991817.1 ABC transporter ATP-binding protein [Oceanirhabdus seepicola]